MDRQIKTKRERECQQIGPYIYSTRRIGKGSFARVYKGLNTHTDELVAVKIIDKSVLKPGVLERFHGELLLLRDLDHPGIVRVLEHFEDSKYFYIILEYCSGGDLAKWIKKRGRLEEAEAKNYLQQIAAALHYLCSEGVVHRDLKPQNILLNGDRTVVKLTDFDFAKRTDSSTGDNLSTTMCGSPMYMAPEIFEAQKYDNRSDLWSVGVILYEMIYGYTPYHKAANIIDLMRRVKLEPIDFYGADAVSRECIELMRGLLQRDPTRRLSWTKFFESEWLESDTDTSPFSSTESVPIPIPPRQNLVNIMDDYTPPQCTPPDIIKSTPAITIPVAHNSMESEKQTIERFMPSRSAPTRRESLDNFWDYLKNSLNID